MKWLLNICVVLLLLSSCKDRETNNETNSSNDNALAETSYSDIFKQNIELTVEYMKGNPPADTNITVDSDNLLPSPTFPFNMSINYGQTNLLGQDGKKRRGTLNIIVKSSDNTVSGIDEFVISFDNFYLNETQMLGTLTITDQGLDANNNQKISVVVSDGKLINGNGTMSWTSTKNLVMVTGAGTSDIIDDTYEVTGSCSGTNFKGREFSASISSKLLLDLSCRWLIVSGKTVIEPLELDIRNVDYGDGACNGTVEVQIGESTYNITLQ